MDIQSYKSLLYWMRRPGFFAWSRKLATFVCQFDAHFSAQFALGMIDLMYAVRTPSPERTVRLLLLANDSTIDPSLEEAMTVAFGEQVFTNVHLGESSFLDIPATALSVPCIMETLLQKCENPTPQSTLLVFCPRETANFYVQILSSDWIYMFNDTSYLEQIRQELIMKKNPSKPKILFMVEPDIVPIPLCDVSTIIICGFVTVDIWERGRKLQQTKLMSVYEKQQALLYWLQCPNEQTVEVVMPAGDFGSGAAMPFRQLDNAQSWGFMADLMLRFPNFLKLAACFVGRPTSMIHTLQSLVTLGFINPSAIAPNNGVPTTARGMAALLGFMDHDFFLARFLYVGIKTPNVTAAARRAMLIIGAIIKSNRHILDGSRLMRERQAVADGPAGLGRDLAAKAAPFFSMPGYLYLHGSIWVSLAVWHVAMHTRPDITTSTASAYMEWPEVPDLLVDSKGIRTTVQTLVQLERKSGMSALADGKAVPLHLTAADCHFINQAFVEAWPHKAVRIEATPESDNPSSGLHYRYQAMDVASNIKCNMIPDITETFRPWAAFGTPGTTPTSMMIAALDVRIDEEGNLNYSNVVLLPNDLAVRWRGANDENIMDIGY